MSEIKVKDTYANVRDVQVYGLEESVKYSGLPRVKSLDDLKVSNSRTIRLATTPIGSGHDQFLTGIVVQLTLKLTKQVMVDFNRYHFLDYVSSQGSVFLMTEPPYNKDLFNEYVDSRVMDVIIEKYNNYMDNPCNQTLYQLVYNMPAGQQYWARFTTNYRQLKTIYSQRKYHKLMEFRDFCRWIETLPNSELITNSEKKKGNIVNQVI